MKQICDRLKKIFFRPKSNQGFTLIEVLAVTVAGSIIFSGLMLLLNNLIQENQKQNAESVTQKSMTRAINYIKDDLQASVYIYNGSSLENLLDYLPFTASSQTVVPILAFWKLETLPYSSSDTLPDCDTIANNLVDECNLVAVQRRSYTLVMYLLSTENKGTWQGESRIIRYQLRKYDDLDSFTQNTGYVDPVMESSFSNWPLDSENNNLQRGTPNNNTNVLVDFVAAPSDKNIVPPACPDTGEEDYTYERSPFWLYTENSKSFFACVGASSVSANNQDVVLYLTGNTKGNFGTTRDNLLSTIKSA